jgi:hypothetical protein
VEIFNKRNVAAMAQSAAGYGYLSQLYIKLMNICPQMLIYYTIPSVPVVGRIKDNKMDKGRIFYSPYWKLPL